MDDAAPARHPALRIALLALGTLMMICSPALGVLPGPGGIVLFAAGLALVLRNSTWAKRVFVRTKRRWPRAGGWADWGMRRPSAARRRAIAREAAQD